jgi:hypothetical protein
VSDFAPPEAPAVPKASRRPIYFVVALLFVWMVGLVGATDGWETESILRQPDAARHAAHRIQDVQSERREEARLDAILAARRTLAPLAAGRMVLGSLLALTAGLTLLGRRRARPLALQAMVAYAVFLPIDYVVRRPMRASSIDAVVEALAIAPPSGSTLPEPAELRLLYFWVYRGALGAELFVLALGFFAMTRPRVRALFRTSAAERAHQQEP